MTAEEYLAARGWRNAGWEDDAKAAIWTDPIGASAHPEFTAKAVAIQVQRDHDCTAFSRSHQARRGDDCCCEGCDDEHAIAEATP